MKKILQKKKIQSRIIVTLLTLAMLFTNMSITAFATEVQPPVDVDNISTMVEVAPEIASQTDNQNEGIMPLGSGYEAHYTDSFVASFYINVTGSSSLLGTAKIKAWDFGNSNIDVYATLYRPDGSAAISNIRLPIGTEITKTFSNLQPGRYRLSYQVYSNVYKGWIYCNIS